MFVCTDIASSAGLSRGSSPDGDYEFQIAGVYIDAYGYGDVTFTHSQVTSTAETPTQIISVSSSEFPREVKFSSFDSDCRIVLAKA